MASSSGHQVISREGFCHCYILQFQSMYDIHKDQDVGHLIQSAPHKPKHHEDPSWPAPEAPWAVKTSSCTTTPSHLRPWRPDCSTAAHPSVLLLSSGLSP